jgi:hypothetical protein
MYAIGRRTAAVSAASTARTDSERHGSFVLPCLRMLAMIRSAFSGVREANTRSPTTSLFWASLWASAQPTLPAPICRTAMLSPHSQDSSVCTSYDHRTVLVPAI